MSWEAGGSILTIRPSFQIYLYTSHLIMSRFSTGRDFEPNLNEDSEVEDGLEFEFAFGNSLFRREAVMR